MGEDCEGGDRDLCRGSVLSFIWTYRVNVTKNYVKMVVGVSEILSGYRRNVSAQRCANTSRLGLSLRPVGLVLDASAQKLLHAPQYQ